MRTEETTIFTVIIIASLFISFFITVFIYFLYKNQKKLQRTKNSLFRLENNINEEERKKITLELHNDIIPTLSGIKLRLILSSQIENTVNQACISELEKSINEIRNLSKRISPMTIYDRTFSTSLRSYIQSTGADQKIKIEIIEKETINLSAEKNALIYRLLQEVLLNTIKHSKAGEFKIEVSIDKNNLLIRTADDGVGYELGKTIRNSGMGLKLMQNIIAELGGMMHKAGKEHRGTKYNFKIPL
jgi:two-component system NarL family sensor kinase